MPLFNPYPYATTGALAAVTDRDVVIHFGDGRDGSATVSSATDTVGTWLTSGVLQRDVYLTTLVMAATGTIKMNGFRVYCSVELDLTNASAGCFYTTTPAAAGAGAAAGTAGATLASTLNVTTAYMPITSLLGGGGGTTTGGQGPGLSTTLYMGGQGGTGGAGGDGTSGAGGDSRTPAAHPRIPIVYAGPIPGRTAFSTMRPSHPGGGGGGGGGDGTSGGGGGAGGIGGESILVSARTVTLGASTAAGLFVAPGGAGGAGGSPAAGDRGSGGGGGGGSGGLVWLTYESVTGTTRTNAFTVVGGAGAVAGTPSGTGTAGDDGTGGSGGTVILGDTSTGICTTYTETTAAAGTVGGYTTVSLG